MLNESLDAGTKMTLESFIPSKPTTKHPIQLLRPSPDWLRWLAHLCLAQLRHMHHRSRTSFQSSGHWIQVPVNTWPPKRLWFPKEFQVVCLRSSKPFPLRHWRFRLVAVSRKHLWPSDHKGKCLETESFTCWRNAHLSSHWANLFSRVSRFFGGPIMIRLLFQVMLVSVLNVIPPSVLLLIVLTIVFQFFVKRSLSLMGFPPCDLHPMRHMTSMLLRIPIMMKSKSLNPNQVQHHIQAPKLLCRHPLNWLETWFPKPLWTKSQNFKGCPQTLRSQIHSKILKVRVSYMTWSPRNPRFRPRMAMFLLITCFVINRHPNIAMFVDNQNWGLDPTNDLGIKLQLRGRFEFRKPLRHFWNGFVLITWSPLRRVVMVSNTPWFVLTYTPGQFSLTQVVPRLNRRLKRLCVIFVAVRNH